MSRYFSFLIATLFFFSSASAFKISGRLLDNTDTSWVQKVYLSRLVSTQNIFQADRQFVVDSALVNKSGEFVFNNESVIVDNNFYRLSVVPEHSKSTYGAYLNMIGTAENYFVLLLNKNTNIKLTSTFKAFNYDMVLEKTDATNDAIAKVSQIRRKENELIDVLVQKRNMLDKEMPGYKDSVKKLNEALFYTLKTSGTQPALEKYADTVADEYASILAVTFIMEPDTALMHKLYRRYTEQIPGSIYTAEFSEKIYGKANAIKIGDDATDFTLLDTEGKKIKLSDYKGSYVLVDFWASWCTPCRKEFSNTIVPMYEKYKAKGFKVLAVSTDKKERELEECYKKIRNDFPD